MANNQRRNSSISRSNSQRSESGKNGNGQRSRQNSQSQQQETTTTTSTSTTTTSMSMSPSSKRQRKTQPPSLSIPPNQQSRLFIPLTPSATTPTYAAVAAAASASAPSSPATPYVRSKRYSPGLPRIGSLHINSPYPSQPASARPRLGAIPEEEPEDGHQSAQKNAPPTRSVSFARRASRSRSRRRHSDSRVHRVGDKHYSLQGYAAQTGPFAPGSIIRVPHFEQHGTTSYPSDWKHRLETEDMGDICFKWRRMVVVTVHKGHHVCLPIYTFNGRGVDPENGKGGQYRDPDEYVPILDHRINIPKTPSGIVIKTRFFKDDVLPLHESSVIALTYPISRRDDCIAILEGRIRASSTRLLLRLYMRQMMKSIWMWRSKESGALFPKDHLNEKSHVLEFIANEIASCEVHDDSD